MDSHETFVTYIAALMLLPSFAMAQWTNVAPNLLAPFRPGSEASIMPTELSGKTTVASFGSKVSAQGD